MAKRSRAWKKIFDTYGIHEHDFNSVPFFITAAQIKDACKYFKKTSDKEVRILCKQDTREDRPQVFIDRKLFLLPIKNGEYAIIKGAKSKGEGYVDIPDLSNKPLQTYKSSFKFKLQTIGVGNSEMQHLDKAFAHSLIRHFIKDNSLTLTIRGRKFTQEFSFKVGRFKLNVKGVQTEVDGGYEGKKKVVLVEAKNSSSSNTIIRQLYYPFRQWQEHTTKPVSTVFFQRTEADGQEEFHLWEFAFRDKHDYNSIYHKRSARYKII